MLAGRLAVGRLGWAVGLAVALAVALVGPGCGRRQVPDSLVLTSLGHVDADLIAHVRDDLAACYGVPVRVLGEQPLPASAFDAGRGQYNGSHLLAALADVPLARAERLLALADVDGAIHSMNFVMGLGQLGGRCAVVFLPRVRAHTDEATFRRRVRLDCRHELGHVYGLRHCPDDLCVMGFCPTVLGLDRRSDRFCSRCQSRLARLRHRP